MADKTCACPRINPRDCVRVRAGEDLAVALDPLHVESDDECDCCCHEEWYQNQEENEDE